MVNVKIFDFINFVCPNENIKLGGTEKTGMDSLYHNLYVKEIPADIKNFEGACDTSGEYIFAFIWFESPLQNHDTYSCLLPKVVGFLRVLWFPPTGNVDRLG